MRLGEYQELIYVKKMEFGIYLSEKEGDEERVLLPSKQVPEGLKLLHKNTVDRKLPSIQGDRRQLFHASDRAAPRWQGGKPGPVKESQPLFLQQNLRILKNCEKSCGNMLYW